MKRWSVLAAVMVGLIWVSAATAADWKNFRGPNRDGKSAETDLLKEWPAGGPTLLWKAPGCGAGYSSPTIVGDTIYTAGDVGGQACLLTFSLDGKFKKGLPIAKAAGVDRPGMRSTPTVDKEAVLILGPEGDLVCANAKTLQEVWKINLRQKFKGQVSMWKYAESVLVDGDKVYCTPGGKDATIVCLDKKTGSVIWTSKGLGDVAEYASCQKFTIGNLPMIVNMTKSGLVAVSAINGQFLWRYNRPANDTANCPSPVCVGDRIFEATGYGHGGGQVEIKVAGDQVTATQTWETRDMVNHHGGYVFVDGYIYGYSDGGGWTCLDWKTGAKKWAGKGVDKGCEIYADGMLYCLGEGNRQVGLIAASPDGYKMVSSFTLPPDGKGDLWAHPAIANGRLYIRHGDVLYCYDIKAPGDAAKPAEKKIEVKPTPAK